MAIGVYFPFQSLSTDQYEEVVRKLEASGAGAPPGRSYHCAFSAGNGLLHVFDVWDSQETFDSFGETLVPMLAEVGVDPAKPQIAHVHNLLVG
jgi:hypothetical protein